MLRRSSRAGSVGRTSSLPTPPGAVPVPANRLPRCKVPEQRAVQPQSAKRKDRRLEQRGKDTPIPVREVGRLLVRFPDPLGKWHSCQLGNLTRRLCTYKVVAKCKANPAVAPRRSLREGGARAGSYRRTGASCSDMCQNKDLISESERANQNSDSVM